MALGCVYGRVILHLTVIVRGKLTINIFTIILNVELE